MTPPTAAPKPRAYLVQVLAGIEVLAADKAEAADLALAELAHRCETGRDVHVRVEEVKG